MVGTGVHTHHDPTTFLELRGNRRNRPQGKCRKDDGSLRPNRTPCLSGGLIWEGERICVIRSTENFQRHDGVQRDHPFGTDGGIRQRHTIAETPKHRTEDMVTLQYFSPSTPRAEKIGNNRRKKGIHRGGANHIWCTASPSRRASRDDKWSTYYHPRNAYTEI